MNKYPSKHHEEPTEDHTELKSNGRKICAETGKACYGSKHEARKSLIGQLASKSIRVYQCPADHGHWHLTKDWAHKRNQSN